MDIRKVEARNRTEFAAFAEPLKIETDRVMSVLMGPKGKRAVVSYTPDPDFDKVWAVKMERDRDGIWQLRGVPKQIGTLSQIMEGL